MPIIRKQRVLNGDHLSNMKANVLRSDTQVFILGPVFFWLIQPTFPTLHHHCFCMYYLLIIPMRLT